MREDVNYSCSEFSQEEEECRVNWSTCTMFWSWDEYEEYLERMDSKIENEDDSNDM